MKITELKDAVLRGALTSYENVYKSNENARSRVLLTLDSYLSLYGDREAVILSVPGRSEISGNHTDHNRVSSLRAQ